MCHNGRLLVGAYYIVIYGAVRKIDGKGGERMLVNRDGSFYNNHWTDTQSCLSIHCSCLSVCCSCCGFYCRWHQEHTRGEGDAHAVPLLLWLQGGQWTGGSCPWQCQVHPSECAQWSQALALTGHHAQGHQVWVEGGRGSAREKSMRGGMCGAVWSEVWGAV